MTVRKTEDVYIRRRRVPLAEVCCPIFKNFRIVYANEIEQTSVDVMLACSRVEVGGVATLLTPVVLRVGWVSNERVKAP